MPASFQPSDYGGGKWHRAKNRLAAGYRGILWGSVVMAIADVSGVSNLVLRGFRRWQRSFALLMASALVGFTLFAMPAQANAQGNDPKN